MWSKECAKCSKDCSKICKDFKEEFCPKHRKPPYVCNGCEKRNDVRRLAPGADVKKGLSILGSAAADARPQAERWLKANGVI